MIQYDSFLAYFQHSEPSEMLTDNPIHEKAKGSRRHHPKKDSKFLPSHGDPTDQMDELDEPYPPPPPPPPPPQSKPNLPQHAGLHDQLHYAELQHAVEDSRTRRSNFIRRAETPYAEVDIANLTKDWNFLLFSHYINFKKKEKVKESFRATIFIIIMILFVRVELRK